MRALSWPMWICLGLVGLMVGILPNAGEAGLKAGAAAVVITPEYDIWLAGYGDRNRPSEGKIHDLYAKALALEDEAGTRLVLVTTDLINLWAEFTDRVAGRLQAEWNLPREAVLFNSSHTHSGPILPDKLQGIHPAPEEQWNLSRRYAVELEDKLIQVVRQALGNLEPAQIAYGRGSAGFGKNRRQYTLEGIINGENPIGPVDHDVPVLRVDGADGAVKAVVFGYACHNTTLNLYRFCGDYAGFAQIALEKKFPGAVALFFAGCGADINPLPRRKVELAERYGEELARGAGQALAGGMKPVEGPLRAAFARIDLALTPAPAKEQLEAQWRQTGSPVIQRCLGLILDEYGRRGSLPETCPYPVQVWRVGNELIVTALGGEVVVDYALRLKYELGAGHTWVMGYSNDVMAYIPSLRILREGGYEGKDAMVEYGLAGEWRPDIEERIVREIHRLVDATER
ncbi:MAG: neutral/alkaline non-lysosomal ceramidase N-terminal domain-containing protein [bacterium]